MLKFLASLLGSQSPAFIWWVTATQGEKVGEDGQGNRYFRGKARKGYTRERRWVLYKGAPEPSQIPPEWHGWMHYQTDIVPVTDATAPTYRKPWQRPHKPNLTGTVSAWYPKGHPLASGTRAKGTGDYEAWTPPQ